MKKRYKDMSKKHEEMESKAEEAKEYEMEDEGYEETEEGKMVKKAKGGMTKSQKKISKVMREFKKGELHSGKSGKVVKNPKQAIAIALSEAGKSKKMMKASEGMLANSSDRLTERDVAMAGEALSEPLNPMENYRKTLKEKFKEAASSDRLTESDIKKVSIVEKAKNVYKKLNSPEMRKMMGTGGVKKMYGGGSVLARGVRFGKNKPTKLF
jgi:ribosomal protein L21E